MTIIIIAVAMAAIIIALLALRQHQRLKAKALECAREVQVFHDKLKRLSAPDHFFTDEELLQVKREYAPLYDKIEDLYNKVLISSKYLNGLGFKEFIRERKFFNHIQYQNNQNFKR